MFKPITTGIIGLALAASALTASSAETKAKGKIASAVAGKLVKVEGKKVKPYTIDASPKYYVLYHSASW